MVSRNNLRRLALAAVARVLPRSEAAEAPPRRLLLIRPDHLGDVLLAGPALVALRQAAPQAHLTLLVGPWAEAVARRGAPVDEILTCNFPGFTRRPKRDPLEPYRLLLRQARQLRGRYDLAVILRPDHWWGALLAATAGVPIRLGYDTPTTRPLLTETLPLPVAPTHVVRLNLALAELAARDTAGRGAVSAPADGGTPPLPPSIGMASSFQPARPLFALTADERSWAAAIEQEAAQPLVLLHAGSGSALKNWPVERWARVADALAERGARVLLTGGGDDLVTPRAVAAAMQRPSLLLAGRTSLGQLGALAERSALALGTDNGPLHLAAALGAPTLRLYGPTDEATFGPWAGAGAGEGVGATDGDHAVLTHTLPCRPCGNLLAPPCGAHREPPCLLGIETERVVVAALERLALHLGSRQATAERPASDDPPRLDRGRGCHSEPSSCHTEPPSCPSERSEESGSPPPISPGESLILRRAQKDS